MEYLLEVWGVETLRFKQGIDSTLFFYAQTKRLTHNNNKSKLTEMKKVLTMIVVLACSLLAQAQNYATLSVEENENGMYYYCSAEVDGVIVYGNPDCAYTSWHVDGVSYHNVDSVVVVFDNQDYHFVQYEGCGLTRGYDLLFDPVITNPFSEPYTWMRTGESLELYAPGDSVYWSTGEYTNGIVVTEPGTYSVTNTNACGSETFPIQVRNNVEIYRSGVDPATNKNRVLWQTTPEQAAYVSSVKVERDGMVVGTVPYLDGQFLDNIGSENAARVYRITGIASDGTECPIPSYQFGTFNTIISPDIANPSLMNFTWEDPFIEEGSPYSVVAYRIGRFNENTGEFVAIDQLSANVHLGKYNMDLFDGEYGIVAAVFNDAKRDNEELAFSNRSENEIVGVGEQNNETFGIYPNPAKDRFIVEGSGIMTVMNTLGQTVMTKEIDGKTTIELPQGLYFVKLGETMRKVVVE